MRDVITCLWYDGKAEEAARFYTSLIEDSRLGEIVRTAEPAVGEPGSVLTVAFELKGQKFVALNGGPQLRFTEAASIQLICDGQEEIDRLWDGLIAGGGQPSRCGWLKDRYGLSWQVLPARLLELMADPDQERAARVSRALLTMGKIEIQPLEEAARSAGARTR